MKLSQTQFAILALIIANIIWGASSPILKWTLYDFHPFTLGFLRFFLSALVILPFAWHRLKIKKQDFILFLYFSVIGIAIRIGYGFYGLQLSTSINDLIIASSAPIFMIIGAVVFFREKASNKVLLGTGISFLGIVVIVMQPLMQKGLNFSLLGNVFLVIAMLLSILYTLLLKDLTTKYHPTTIFFWSFIMASLTLFPFAWTEVSKHPITTLHMQGIVGISFTVLLSTVLAYFLHLYGVKYIKASELGIFSYVDPFVGIGIAGPLLGEHITTSFFFGSSLVFMGIFIAEGRIHYHPLHLLFRKDQPQRQTAPQFETIPNKDKQELVIRA